jgi:sucrose-6-phosphate hydrolase SacC (GH32 family)
MGTSDLHPTDLLAWWPFDEGHGRYAADCIGQVADPIAYVFNQARYKPSSDPLWRAGIRGHALMFDGYSTWVTRAADQLPKPAHALTIAAWVAPASFEHGDERRLSAIVNQHDREERRGYILGVFRHGTWSFQVGAGDEWLEVWAEACPLPRNRWSYVVATYDSLAGRMVLYLNGELVAERAIAFDRTITPCLYDLLIGKNNKGTLLQGVFTANMFHGLIDEVQLYRRALTADEVRARYAAYLDGFGGGVPPTPDLAPRRSRYDGDIHRPQYHFIPPEHWMNEPHAPLHFRGRYHLFYQHNPQGPYWHQIHWGHAVSDDLVHWRDLPYALVPGRDAVDPDGCWSGSAVIGDEGVPVIFYTAGDNRRSPNQAIALARSTFKEDGDADLKTWTKHPEPVVVQQPGIGRFGEFRDPFVWREDGIWYMLVASGIPDRGGTALVYSSADLLCWNYHGPLYIGDLRRYPKTGEVWELPVFLPLGWDEHGRQKHILIINPWFAEPNPYYCKYVFYWIGTWDRTSHRFLPDDDEPQVIDLGEHFIGPSAMIDAHGRLVLFTITRDGLSPKQQHDLGWAHNAGLPVVLQLRPDGRLGVEPIPELRSLRQEHLLSLRGQPLDAANRWLRMIHGAMLEIQIEFADSAAGRYGLAVRRSPDGQEETVLMYDADADTLCADRRRSSLDRDVETSVVGGVVGLRGERLRLHVYVDHSMIEVYINGLKSLTTRVYPTRRDAIGLQIQADRALMVQSLDIWQLQSAYGT